MRDEQSGFSLALPSLAEVSGGNLSHSEATLSGEGTGDRDSHGVLVVQFTVAIGGFHVVFSGQHGILGKTVLY